MDNTYMDIEYYTRVIGEERVAELRVQAMAESHSVAEYEQKLLELLDAECPF